MSDFVPALHVCRNMVLLDGTCGKGMYTLSLPSLIKDFDPTVDIVSMGVNPISYKSKTVKVCI
jgi:hypothetical protein